MKKQYDFTGTQLMIKQEELEVMDAEEYSYFLAYGMTEEQHQLESLIANTCADS